MAWLEGRRDHAQGGAVAMNMADTCLPIRGVSLVTSLVSSVYICRPVMHIYTGIKYIALYNIIYVCGIQAVTSNEG